MKYLPLFPSILAVILGALLWHSANRPAVFLKPDPIPLDTAYRSAQTVQIKTLQARVDSLTTLAKVVRAYPTRKLDSIIKIKSVVRDSLRCVDESTYRDLVISRMNFGEEKYSLCLGQLALKDSIEVSYQRDLDLAAFKYEEVSLKLAAVERRKYHWLIGGLLVGIGASLAVMYAN